ACLNVPTPLPYIPLKRPAMSCSMREYDPDRMSRCPSPSMSTNCGVEEVHHQTPGTSASLPSACSQVPLANFPPPSPLKNWILPLLNCPTRRSIFPSPSTSAKHGDA